MRAQRGFSLVEVMAALVVLAIVITTTLGMFVERRKHLRNANETILAHPADGLARCANAPVDACVVMTHTASNDLAALHALQEHPVRYVGLLGPPRRRDELLDLLGDEGRTALKGRLHAPVGLDLGGQGPESLALAIAAELQRYFSELR